MNGKVNEFTLNQVEACDPDEQKKLMRRMLAAAVLQYGKDGSLPLDVDNVKRAEFLPVDVTAWQDASSGKREFAVCVKRETGG